MREKRNRFHDIFSVFHRNLVISQNKSTALQSFQDLLPLWSADSATFMRAHESDGMVSWDDAHADLAPQELWQRYRQMCKAAHDPLSRTLRLTPHPVALSDLRGHARLSRRSARINDLFEEYGFGDALALPILDRLGGLNVVLIAGANLRVGPTSRHQMARVATETVLRLQSLDDASRAPLNSQQTPSLTERQLEIANWLVAGKSDWEIGEILRLSPKTVNYHVEKMKRTYGVRSRNQFVAAIVRDGGIAPPSL